MLSNVTLEPRIRRDNGTVQRERMIREQCNERERRRRDNGTVQRKRERRRRNNITTQ